MTQQNQPHAIADMQARIDLLCAMLRQHRCKSDGAMLVAQCIDTGRCCCTDKLACVAPSTPMPRREAIERALVERGLVVEESGRDCIDATVAEVLDAVMAAIKYAGETT